MTNVIYIYSQSKIFNDSTLICKTTVILEGFIHLTGGYRFKISTSAYDMKLKLYRK